MVVENPKRTTKLQLSSMFKKPDVGGIINLRGLDFTAVNMQDAEVKRYFSEVSAQSSENLEDPRLFIDMTGSDISGTDVRGYDLSNVIMTDIKAHGTVFINCALSDTQLDRADLQNADFRQANMFHTKFYEANMDGVNFSGSNLKYAHGLGQGDEQRVMARLGRVSTIRDAILPDYMEPMREKIQDEIRSNRQEVPEHAADLIEVDDEDEKESEEELNKDVKTGFFGSNWLKRKSDKLN